MKVIHEDNFKYVGDTSVSSINKKIFLLFGVQHQIIGLDKSFWAVGALEVS